MSYSIDGYIIDAKAISFRLKKMIYGYIRVSSDKQTVENQRFDINNFGNRENLAKDG